MKDLNLGGFLVALKHLKQSGSDGWTLRLVGSPNNLKHTLKLVLKWIKTGQN